VAMTHSLCYRCLPFMWFRWQFF